MNESLLHSRVALISGGASGIGLATAQALAAEGTRVCIFDKDGAAADEAASRLEERPSSPGQIMAVAGDVSLDADACRAIDLTVEEFGQIDILVNSAGITTTSSTMWETPPETFEELWRVHLFGTFLMCRHAVPRMIDSGYGRIVNVASVAGKEGNTGSSAYSSAKAAVIGLTKSLGKELAQLGVLVNCVTPGIVRTPLFEQATPEHIARLQAKIPMNRAGEPEEVAELIAWLASSRCSFSTGAVFDASGGRSTY